MSHNDTIYSGLSAHPAHEIVEELHYRDWYYRDWPDENQNFRDLVGALTTLARTVDEQARKIAALNASLVAVGRVVDRHSEHINFPRTDAEAQAAARPMGPLYSEPFATFEHGMRALDSEAKLRERLALVYAGLADMRRLCALGAGPGTPEHARAAEAAVIAIHARLSAMLEAAGKLPD